MEQEKHIANYFDRKKTGIVNRLKTRIKKRLGWLGLPQIVAYRGYGSVSTGEAYVVGTLMEDKGLEKIFEKNSLFQNILAMLKRYSSDQIPDAPLNVSLGDEEKTLVTNENGLFSARFKLPAIDANSKTQWLKYEARLNPVPELGEYQNAVNGELLIPGNNAEYAVISDIDDTIMVSHSTQTLRKLRLMLTRNSRTRKPFPGVESFYRALHRGVNNTSVNPFFYISSSEWNLYDLIEDFCAFNGFPKGVFLLREVKSGILKLVTQGGGTHEHKFQKIDSLFKAYPKLHFVLVGDNGQHDPYIYSRVARKYAKRIKAIYIRTVKKRKDKRMVELIAKMEKLGIPMVFSNDSINAAQHAQSINLIKKSAIEKVVQNSLTD